jgi:hypothetical protein
MKNWLLAGKKVSVFTPSMLWMKNIALKSAVYACRCYGIVIAKNPVILSLETNDLQLRTYLTLYRAVVQ